MKSKIECMIPGSDEIYGTNVVEDSDPQLNRIQLFHAFALSKKNRNLDFYRGMKSVSLFIFVFVLTISACKKDKAPKIGVPELTTTDVINITAITAMSGGDIKNNGGETITASGICWSTTNQTPTVSDDTTRGNAISGSFTAMLINLSPSSKYYVRAYAINRTGTGYGNVVTFNTGNGSPVATAVTISGNPKGGELLTGNYTYSDSENDTESGSTFQWYVAGDATGTGEEPIVDATEKTFRIEDEQEGKYIRFGVTPKAGVGSMTGVEVKSAFVGAVGEATSVTFMYNGNEVTYGIINGTSGLKWLDRNLGASRIAQAIDDYQAYGDLFQWGRSADGHQLMTRTASSTVPVNGTTVIRSSNDNPSTNNFITDATIFGDWRNPQALVTSNTNPSKLWQGTDGVNNPCPLGWHVPTKEEWLAENLTTGTDAFDKLKLTFTSSRVHDTGNFGSFTFGNYWTSSVKESSDGGLNFSIYFYMSPDVFDTYHNNRGKAYACRCVK